MIIDINNEANPRGSDEEILTAPALMSPWVLAGPTNFSISRYACIIPSGGG
jgi:hypothetical protein